MKQDETDRPRAVASHRPDPAFFERLEDDSQWQDQPRPMRRTDRYANQHGDRRSQRAGRPGESGSERNTASKRTPPRSRRIAVVVFVVVAVILLVVGLGLRDTGSSGSTPFSLLPLDSSAITATTAGSATTSSTASSTTTTGSATTTTTGP